MAESTSPVPSAPVHTPVLNDRLEPIFRFVVQVLEQKGIRLQPKSVFAD